MKNRVLLFGQSAGASNAFAIATMKHAPEIIRAAAFQSGGGRDYATVAQAEPWHHSFAEQLGCENIDVGHLPNVTISITATLTLTLRTRCPVSAPLLFPP